jgi:4-amino-4-deoxy-L-arabinose transferase-like glycosyltransferase
MSTRNWFARRSRLREFLWLSVLFFASLLPRLAAVGRYVTPDELAWVYRSVLFRQALLAGEWLGTLTAGHPGVITTWLGSLGVSLQLLVRPQDTAVYDWATHVAWFTPDNTVMLDQLYTFLTAGRLIVAIANSLGVVLIFLLARKLYGRVPAILIALLLAFDPFLVGLSGLLHVDGLMTTFTTLSLLALALSIQRRNKVDGRFLLWAALAGLTAGLAILTKSPALLLPPFVALFLLLTLFYGRTIPFKTRFWRAFKQGLVWLGGCLFTILLLFPALWVSPLQVVEMMSSTSESHVGALRPTFFLGQELFDPGPAFYLLVIPLRLSPVVLCGLLLALFLIISGWARRKHAAPWNRLETWLFLFWPPLFLTAISFATLKYDRYTLPIIPALIVIASLGWLGLPALQTRLTQTVAALSVVQLIFLGWVMPYPLTAVNPLLGGPKAAQRIFDVGWGEAESAAARWLATQPDTENQTAVSWNPPALAPFFPGRTFPAMAAAFPHANYMVVAADDRSELPADATLLHTIRFNGLERAAIYAQPAAELLPTPEPLPAPVKFGSNLALLAANTAVQPDTLQVVLRWQQAEPKHGRYTVQFTLRDTAGRTWAGLETLLLNDVYFYPEHWTDGETPDVTYQIPLPPGLPPAEYQLEVALFDQFTQAQLPLLAADGTFQGVTQPLGTVQTGLPLQPAAAYDFDPPIALVADWGDLRLLAQNDFPPRSVVNGDDLLLDLYWRADAELSPGLQVETTLGDLTISQPLSRFDTGNWRPGEIIHEKTAVPLPPTMPGDVYSLQIRPLAADGRPLGDAVHVGRVEVIALDRQFELPPNVLSQREDSFGRQLTLRGLEIPQPSNLTLYWQVTEKPDHVISVFVHLLDESGEIVAQSDQWPGGLPANLWAVGQVITDEHTLNLPPDLPPGEYTLAIGLYDPATGQRLPALDGNGRAHPDNQIILPLAVNSEQ